MIIEYGINPNCSECAIVIYPDKLTISQKQLFTRFCEKKKLTTKVTKKGNYVIESNYEDYPANKSNLWALADDLEIISEWVDNKMRREVHFDLIRDECYEDMLENGDI